jgi:hypothetical protein
MQWLTGHHYIRRHIKVDQIASVLGTISHSLSLWPMLALLLLLMLVLESLQCRKMARLTRADDLPATQLSAMTVLEH